MARTEVSEIHNYWENQAIKFGDSSDVSWKDVNMINLEIRNIRPYIEDGDLILDAGCSNGYSTVRIGEGKKVKIKAIDYSIKSIEVARGRQQTDRLYRDIVFEVGDIGRIEDQQNTFDKVYSIRVIINIPDWAGQKEAICEIHRVLKPGGLYLLSEAFTGSLRRLNALRAMAGMAELKAPHFNNYLREEELEDFVKDYFEVLDIKRFSSIYYAGSRFLRYLTMRKGEPDSYVNNVNSFFMEFEETENSGDFGIQKLYVLKKI